MKKDNTKNSTNKKTGMSGAAKVALVSGAAALGAGAYYLLGPKSKIHQKKAKEIVTKIKKEVSNELKKAKEVTIPV